MKYSVKFATLLFIVLIFSVGCQQAPKFFEPIAEGDDIIYKLTETNGWGQEYPIWAGQNIDAGTLHIWNDNDNLYVIFKTSGDWLITETHVGIFFSVPPRRPAPGQLAYKQVYPEPYVTESKYIIPLVDFNLEVDNTIYVAAHAVVVTIGYNEYEQIIITDDETGWGGDNKGPGKAWWFYAEYTIEEYEDIEEPEYGTETAMLRMNDDPNDDTHLWGDHRWFTYVKVTPTYEKQTFYFYAGQKHRVGEVDIWKEGGQLVVEIKLDDEYFMTESHLNVQLDGYSGSPSFGNFPYKAVHNPVADSYTYYVDWINDWDEQELNIALHAVVGPF